MRIQNQSSLEQILKEMQADLYKVNHTVVY